VRNQRLNSLAESQELRMALWRVISRRAAVSAREAAAAEAAATFSSNEVPRTLSRWKVWSVSRPITGAAQSDPAAAKTVVKNQKGFMNEAFSVWLWGYDYSRPRPR